MTAEPLTPMEALPHDDLPPVDAYADIIGDDDGVSDDDRKGPPIRLPRGLRVLDGGNGAGEPQLLVDGRGQIKPTLGNAMILLGTGTCSGVWAYDERSCRVVQVRQPPWSTAGGWRPRALRDEDAAHAVHWLEQTRGAAFGYDTAMRAIVTVGRLASYDPVAEVLERLTWDGQPRLPTWLSVYLGAEPTPLSQAMGRAWMISAVARALAPGCQADHVLVLEGEQGALKSSAVIALATLDGHPYVADELGDLHDKDAAIRLQGAWLVEIAELESFRRAADVATIKAFVTRRTDHYRPPYGRMAEDFPRRVVFAGTTNETTYLRDSTGGRRFWPVTTGKIDIQRLREDAPQLWAEAVHRYRAGEIWWLTGQHVAAVAEEQEGRFEGDPWESALREWALHLESATTAEALAELGIEPAKQGKQESMRAGEVLRRLGLRYRRRSTTTRGREYRLYRSPYRQGELPAAPPQHGVPPSEKEVGRG